MGRNKKSPGMGHDEDLVHFPCEGCGKLIAADRVMAVVACGRCGLRHPVPTPREADLARAREVRIVGLSLTVREIARLGGGLLLALAPSIVLAAAAACGVVWFARWVWEP